MKPFSALALLALAASVRSQSDYTFEFYFDFPDCASGLMLYATAAPDACGYPTGNNGPFTSVSVMTQLPGADFSVYPLPCWQNTLVCALVSFTDYESTPPGRSHVPLTNLAL